MRSITKYSVMLIMGASLIGCSSLAGIASSAAGIGGAPPIDVTAQIGAENESNKLKLSQDNSNEIDELNGDWYTSTYINMAPWMILVVWFSGILVDPKNVRGYFTRRRKR